MKRFLLVSLSLLSLALIAVVFVFLMVNNLSNVE